MKEEQIRDLLKREAEIEYKIDHFIPPHTLATSAKEKLKAKELWETRPDLIPSKYHQDIIEKFSGHLSEEKVKKLMPLLTWRGAKALEAELEIDLLPIFKAWRHELASKINQIYARIDKDFLQSTLKSRQSDGRDQKTMLPVWLKAVSESHSIDPDWQKADDLNVIKILAVTKALIISGDTELVPFVMKKFKEEALFINIKDYCVIERLKGNGYRYGMVFGAALSGVFEIRDLKDSELPATVARLLNLVFMLNYLSVVNDLVKIIKDPQDLSKDIKKMQNQVSAQYLLRNVIDISSERKDFDIQPLSNIFSQLDYTELPMSTQKQLMSKAYELAVAPRVWFPILLKLQPTQMTVTENYELFHMCFTLWQHVEMSGEFIQWKEQASYRAFLHLIYGLYQDSFGLASADIRETGENFGIRWWGNLLGFRLSSFPYNKESKEYSCDHIHVKQIQQNADRFYRITEGLRSSGLFSPINTFALVLDYAAEEATPVVDCTI